MQPVNWPADTARAGSQDTPPCLPCADNHPPPHLPQQGRPHPSGPHSPAEANSLLVCGRGHPTVWVLTLGVNPPRAQQENEVDEVAPASLGGPGQRRTTGGGRC